MSDTTGDGVFGTSLRRGGYLRSDASDAERNLIVSLPQYGQAKQTYLLACKNSASCLTWLGVGIACYRVSAIACESSCALTGSVARDRGLLGIVPFIKVKLSCLGNQCS